MLKIATITDDHVLCMHYWIPMICLHRWMYWTDITTDRIERASMDGKSRTVLHSTGLSVARALTMDYDNQVLYWADDSYSRIERSNPDGSNRLVVTTISSSYAPFAMTYYSGRVYWADTYSSYRRIFSTSVTSPSITSVTSRLSYALYGIQVVAKERQPRGVCSFFISSHSC